MRTNILITAGEASGDIHAANLIQNLKKLNPDLYLFGIGGEKMQEAGVNLIERMDKFSIVGIWEVFSKIRKIHHVYRKILKKAQETHPDIVILVDYPGFNLALARALKKRGSFIIYYITPQVWAWGSFRIRLIKKYIDKAIVILKFEEDLFRKHGIDATFVGHPLLDRAIKEKTSDKKTVDLDENKITIALLPGSRESEVSKMLPLMLKTAEIIRKEKNVQFLLLKTSAVPNNIYENILQASPVPIVTLKDDTYSCLSVSDFVFTASGTATLESAIMEKPMIITYKTSFVTAFIFKLFAKTKSIGLVNIIANKKIVPEILQYDATPKRLASQIIKLLSSRDLREEQIAHLRQIRLTLGEAGSSLRAAQIIEKFVRDMAGVKGGIMSQQ